MQFYPKHAKFSIQLESREHYEDFWSSFSAYFLPFWFSTHISQISHSFLDFLNIVSCLGMPLCCSLETAFQQKAEEILVFTFNILLLSTITFLCYVLSVVENSHSIYFSRFLVSYSGTTELSQLLHPCWNLKNLILVWISISKWLITLKNLFFNVSIGHLYILFYEFPIKVSPICLNVLNISSLSTICSTNRVSQSVTYFLIFLMFPFDEKMFLVLISLHWSFTFFSLLVFHVLCK